jgi:hypothetical protein
MIPDKALLGQLSVILVAASTLIYWRLMLLRRIKPHLFTWLIWGLSVGIAAAGRHVEHAGPGAWSMAAMSLGCLSVAVLSLRYGERDITRGDVMALLACLAALPLWYATKNALLAIILVTAIDLGGYYPTVRKSWLRPHEEATYNFVLSNIVHTLSLLANEVHTLATMLTPSCILAANSSLIGMIWWRRARLAARTALAPVPPAATRGASRS